MDDARALIARGLWTLYEPVHAVSYFAPAALEAFERAGLRGFWRGYFAGRAAPLGEVAAAPVIALFSSFAPTMVERALPSVWALAGPEDVLDARAAGAGAAIRAAAPATDPATVAAVAAELGHGLPIAGRALAAANAALPVREDPSERLWQAVTTLREWRGDAHIAALVSHGLAGLDVLALRCRLDLDRTSMQRARGWTDSEWVVAEDQLRERGLLAGDDVTPHGQDVLASVERATDELSVMGTADEMRRLGRLLQPIAVECAALLPFPNPIGLIAAWDPERDPDAHEVTRP